MGSTQQKYQQFENEIARTAGGSLRPVPRWARIAASLALLVVGCLLSWLPGAFPPPVWSELYRLVRGNALLPLPVHLAVIVRSLTLLVAWLLLLYASVRVIQLWRSDPRQQLRRSPLVLAASPVGNGRGQTTGDVRARMELVPASPLAAKATTAVERLQVPVEVISSARFARGAGTGILAGALPTTSLSTLVFDTSCSSSSRPALPAMYAGPGDPTVLGARPGATGLGLTVGSCCHPGSGRSVGGREDALLLAAGLRLKPAAMPSLLPLGLFVVVDGFTCQEEGQLRSSSRMAVESIGDALLSAILAADSGEPEEVEQLVLESIQRANSSLYTAFPAGQPPAGTAGTTLTVALVLDTAVYIANVGDSRAYLYRTGEGLMQVTFDHTAVESEGAGAYAASGRVSPVRDGQLYRSLGARREIEADLYAIQLEVGDMLLLCSNGLWRSVEPALLEQTVQWFARLPVADPFRLCSILREAALEAGGTDQLSVVAVQVTSLPPGQDPGAGARRPEALRWPGSEV